MKHSEKVFSVTLIRDFNELTPDLHLEPANDGWLL